MFSAGRMDKVDNSNCILLEFPNHDNYLSCGYLNWVREEDKLQIESVINDKKIIKIKWPTNYEVEQASIMNKILEKVKWEQHPARILASGGKY